MKKSLIALAALATLAACGTVRARTNDVAFSFRMGAGFPGDVNRTHPASILPGLMDVSDPVRLYGDAVLLDSVNASYRGLLGDDADLATPVQAAATTSTAGGTGLAASTTYFYRVSALNALGETLASNEVSILTGAGATNSNTVNWGLVAGATNYRIYRGLAANAQNVFYTVGAVNVFVDTGAAATQGFPAAANTTGVSKIAGVLVRPYPTQQTTGGMSSALGAATPPVTGVIDVLRNGFIMVRANNFAAAPPVKGGAVYVWVAASAGTQVQGGFSTVAGGVGETAAIANARFNGPPDANGICEIEVWAA